MANEVSRRSRGFRRPNCTISRPLDMAYDPNVIYTSPGDQCQEALRQKRFCQFKCLLDESKLALNRTLNTKHKMDPFNDKQIEVFYYTRPKPKPPQSIQEKVKQEKEAFLVDQHHKDYKENTKHSCGVQTMFREMEIQTDVWMPPEYELTCEDPFPELLILANLGWKLGFVPSMHEVKIIKRMRIRRAWEKHRPYDLSSEESRMELFRIYNALQLAEWRIRDEYLATIIALRMELARSRLDDYNEQRIGKLLHYLHQYSNMKRSNNEIALINLNLVQSRTIRRLRLDRAKRLKQHDQIQELVDRTSETYVHLKRNGYLARHENIDIGLEVTRRLATIPRKLEKLTCQYKPLVVKRRCVQPRGWELCVRYTKYTEEKLEKLVNEMRSKRHFKTHLDMHSILDFDRIVGLKFDPDWRPPSPPPAQGIENSTEQRYQAALMLQKIIEGRAIQETMCSGRRDCAELIDEIRCQHALHKLGLDRLARRQLSFINKYRRNMILESQRLCITGILGDLVGVTLSRALDFLTKEYSRLKDERRIHAHVLLAERARLDLECIEARKRQEELARRREQDAMFMQIMKVTQESVDFYLQDVIAESSEWASARETKHRIEVDAHFIDDAATATLSTPHDYLAYEQIAELVHTFLIPESVKDQMRKRCDERQKLYIKAAHEYIYGDFDEEDFQMFVKQFERSQSSTSEVSVAYETVKKYFEEPEKREKVESESLPKIKDRGSYENYVERIQARLREKHINLHDYLRLLRRDSFKPSEIEILKHVNIFPSQKEKRRSAYEDFEETISRPSESSEVSSDVPKEETIILKINSEPRYPVVEEIERKEEDEEDEEEEKEVGEYNSEEENK